MHTKLHDSQADKCPVDKAGNAVETWRMQIDPKDVSRPQFMVGVENGFLPRQDPLPALPERFKELESLLQRMPIVMANGQPGLLASGKFGEAVEKELPLYDLSDIEDTRLLAGLYRDYTFVASAYLLEPCDLNYRTTKDYGLGRDRLPRNIAVPLATVAKKIGAKPFMEYALSYSLYNYRRTDTTKPPDYPNLELIRAFGGTKSEHGFILVHVSMVRHSGALVNGVLAVVDGASSNNRQAFNQGLVDVCSTLSCINSVMESMWNRSRPSDYDQFRTFIMGTKNQPMFPHGVVYEGVSEEPTFFRGESGANDSMIPTIDNLLQLTLSLPENPLTSILRDFRSYRPTNHSEFVQWVEHQANRVNVRQFAEADPNSAVLYLKIVDGVRNFRSRHWNFTKEYILRYSSHPVATGGSPIVTWLPNQLGAVLRVMQDVISKVNTSALTEDNKAALNDIAERVSEQREILDREVADLQKRFPNQSQLAVV
ncbi:hypothetical protein PBRA_006156 [Plasmodiophora brassicae]|nr:hypothetical protein PBRA_006156 [Plasmodiophora brassicae]